MPPVDPFWFKTATVWHKAILLNRETQTVIALCSQTADYSRRNKKYEDVETRPYAAKVCKRCDTNEPMRVMQRASRANSQVRVHESDQVKGTPPEEDEDGEVVQSSPRHGYSYDDAMRRKPRRILP